MGAKMDFAPTCIHLLFLLFRELAVIQIAVKPALFQQIVMRALLDYIAVVHHENRVRVPYGRQPVRDDKACLAFHQYRHGFLNQDFRPCID